MNDLISVIVPVYNVEKYLDRCVNSILNQSYSKLEIILIDDGAEDSSGSLCDDYAKKDIRISVVHQLNRGLSGARNTGIKKATGKYLVFIDSDDYVSPKYIEFLYQSCIEYHVEVSVCAFKTVSKEKYQNNQLSDIKVMTGKEFVRNTYNKNIKGVVSACNKMYLRSLFDNAKFPEGKIHEDTALIYKILYKAKNVSYISNELYYYYLSPNSITRGDFSLKRLDWIEALDNKLIFLIKNNEQQLYERTLQEYEAVVLKLIYLSSGKIKESKEIRKILLEKYSIYLPQVLKSKIIKVKVKLLFIVGEKFPDIIGKIINMFV